MDPIAVPRSRAGASKPKLVALAVALVVGVYLGGALATASRISVGGLQGPKDSSRHPHRPDRRRPGQRRCAPAPASVSKRRYPRLAAAA
jgi:hypothetical protein